MSKYLTICTKSKTPSFRLLSTSEGSILDDEALVNALQSSKKTSEEVKEQLEVAEQTEVKIDSAREVGKHYLSFNTKKHQTPQFEFSFSSHMCLMNYFNYSRAIDLVLNEPLYFSL